jgi:Mce-associated membrane protein
MSPTWYDVLGVPRDASAEEIKAAWRHATDKFEPGQGSGQFRMFNEAADTLLDPARRAEYDASLDGAAAPVTTVPEPPAEETAPSTHDDTVAVAPARKDERRAARAERAARPSPTRPPASGRLRALCAVLAALALVAAGLAVWFSIQVRQDAAVDDARTAAPAAAERAAKAMLSYDYEQLAADRNRATGFLTPSYRKEYLQTFGLLEKNKDGTPGVAVQTKTVVTATVQGSAVVDAEADKATVLVFVNQVSRKAGGDPQIFQNRVTMAMERSGNRWLVDGLKSY